MPRRLYTGGPTLLAIGAWVVLLGIFDSLASVACATAAGVESAPRGALVGERFIKDSAMARLLGETLFHDTVEVMSDGANLAAAAESTAGKTDSWQDNSAAARVARTVLARRKLDKYLWLIRRAYHDTLWRGADRTQIEHHFPLIWRTSIMLYEASVTPSPHRIRVCTPADDTADFDCRDEIERAKIVPIPAQVPLIGLLHQPLTG